MQDKGKRGGTIGYGPYDTGSYVRDDDERILGLKKQYSSED
jgi:hypothetical protein